VDLHVISDQLRDGQEIAGWRVLVWREITMEAVTNYSVSSDPLVANNDGDLNSDFVEFQNGSDPWLSDTDGDGMNDSNESSQGGNVTGFYMQAPRFMPFVDVEVPGFGRVRDDGVAIWKECRGGALSTFGCTPYARVAFNVSSYWGVGWWEVRYGKPTLNATEGAEIKNITGYDAPAALLMCALTDASHKVISKDNCDRMQEIIDHAKVAGQTKADHAAGAKNFTMYVEFQMTTAEDHWDGPFIEVDVFDIYGAGVERTVKLKSTLEKVLDVLSAIAKMIAEGISWILHFVFDKLVGMVRWIHDQIEPLVEALGNVAIEMYYRFSAGGATAAAFIRASFGPLEGFIDCVKGVLKAIMDLLRPILDLIESAVQWAIDSIGDALGVEMPQLLPDIPQVANVMQGTNSTLMAQTSINFIQGFQVPTFRAQCSEFPAGDDDPRVRMDLVALGIAVLISFATMLWKLDEEDASLKKSVDALFDWISEFVESIIMMFVAMVANWAFSQSQGAARGFFAILSALVLAEDWYVWLLAGKDFLASTRIWFTKGVPGMLAYIGAAFAMLLSLISLIVTTAEFKYYLDHWC